MTATTNVSTPFATCSASHLTMLTDNNFPIAHRCFCVSPPNPHNYFPTLRRPSFSLYQETSDVATGRHGGANPPPSASAASKEGKKEPSKLKAKVGSILIVTRPQLGFMVSPHPHIPYNKYNMITRIRTFVVGNGGKESRA